MANTVLPNVKKNAQWRGFTAAFSSSSGECDSTLESVSVFVKHVVTGKLIEMDSDNVEILSAENPYRVKVKPQMLNMPKGVIEVEMVLDNGAPVSWLTCELEIE